MFPKSPVPPAKSYELLVYGDGPSPPSPVLDGYHIMDGLLLPKQFADSESSLLELVSEGVEGLAQLHTMNREIEYMGEGSSCEFPLLCSAPFPARHG